MERRRRILVAPLDWGLGHATRCIPIINALLKRNAEVIIAGSGVSAILLKDEFPTLTHYSLPGYAPQYSTSFADSAMIWAMGRQLPHFIKTINQEHAQINQLVKKEKIAFNSPNIFIIQDGFMIIITNVNQSYEISKIRSHPPLMG